MHDQLTMEHLETLRGAPVFDSAGEKIGKVEELFYDHASGRPEWLGLGTGFFGTKRVIVPLEGAQIGEDGVFVRYAKEQVKDSPDIDGDEISPQLEQELYAYYALAYRGDAEAGGRDYDRQVDLERADQDIVRSEEELKVGKRGYEAGRLRLHKWVETQRVEAPVELQRETARVTRERIDRPVGDHVFGEEHVEVPLHAEEPVVEKQAVAKERIAVDKAVETEQHTVGADVRKERVDVEGDDLEEEGR